jgi:uncharacterized repeat protein (TIGR01451 family)
MKFKDRYKAPEWRALLLFSLPLWFLSSSPAAATDLTVGAAGRVSIELLSSEAAFRNTLSVVSPSVAVAVRGCQLEPANGLPGVHAVSEKISQRGCRVTLDSDPGSAGIQPFAAGATFQFGMCAQTDADPDCEFVWSSDPSLNPDGVDHVITTELFPAALPGQVYRLAWEDRDSSGGDFNDLIVVVRVERDSDGDGLWDDWERFGIDTDGDGTIDLNLPALGANPLRKDIFLEIDWMDCQVAGSDCAAGDTHNHRPLQGAVDGVVQAFANANVSNPDGSSGISLHVDVSNSFAHRNFLAIPNLCVPGDAINFNTVKANPANFGPTNPRRFAYHYNLFTHRQAATTTSSGCGELPGNDFQVSLGAFTGGVGTLMQQAGTLMHEFGHNLNLQHGGSSGVNFKPNYLSIMSYRYQVSGIPPTDPDGAGPLTARIDYSRSALAALPEVNLSEPAGIGDGTDNAFFLCPDGSTVGSGIGNAALDWSCDGDRIDLGVASDVNGDGNRTTLAGFSDWANLKYDFQNTKDFEDGVHSPLQEPELDLETYEATVAPELSIAKTALPATVLTGSNVTYSITVTDQRPEQAASVRVADVLPPSMTRVSCAATGGGTCGGTGRNVTVDFPVLPGGSSAAITLVANLSCSVADGTVIPNTATVDFSQPDPDPSNNSATATVKASNPPPVISNVATDKTTLSPPNHKMVDVTVSYKVTDNCGVPVCRLAVTSNEPVNDPGSGNTSPDWEVLDAHHVRLRAERSGTGSGRVYTIGIACTDDGGAVTTTTAAVTVPH